VRSLQPELAAGVLELIAPHVRIFGPDGFGDGHLIGDYAKVPHGRKDGWSGFIFDTYTDVSPKHMKMLPGDRILPCYSIYASNDSPVPLGAIDWNVLSTVKRKGSDPESLPHFLVRPQPKGFTKNGVLKDTLPGVTGYKKITIYTLTYP